ncbi:NAD-dependent deacylase [Bacillus tianshenii]|nr:NAD-dependent deacylase [Bacillus tianshenii]
MLHKWLDESNYTVVMTGAGMSTESGLPDFRSKEGLWKQKDPMTLANTEAMVNNRDEFLEFYTFRINGLIGREPHRGHQLLAKWEEEGLVQSIITQNVDDFHHKAGNKRVAELHGTLRTVRCHTCHTAYPNSYFAQAKYDCDCGGMLRPSVVLFGEMLPMEAIEMAYEEASKAELFIVLGSSLQVSPANSFPAQAKKNGAKLVIINMEETAMDQLADEVIHGRKIGDVLAEVEQNRSVQR